MAKERTVWCLVDRKKQTKWRFELIAEDTMHLTFNRYDGKFKNETKIVTRSEARAMWRQLKAQGFTYPF